MSRQNRDPVVQELEDRGIPFRLFTHREPLKSLEQAARERDQMPEQVVRSILFRCSGGSYVMVLVPGPQQISWPALRRFLDVSRISMASKEEVLNQTGFTTGAVCPFGLPQPMRILADEAVFRHKEVSLGSGIRYRALIMKTVDLRRALNKVEMGRFLDR